MGRMLSKATTNAATTNPALSPASPNTSTTSSSRTTPAARTSSINVTPPDVAWPESEAVFEESPRAYFGASSDDLSHVVFTEELPLTAEAEEISAAVKEACERRERACWKGNRNLYEWANGEVRLVTILPDGAPVLGSLAGAPPLSGGNLAGIRHAVSAHGSRTFFEAEGSLYVRLNPMQLQSALGSGGECTEAEMACTVQVDAAAAGAPGPSGGGSLPVMPTPKAPRSSSRTKTS